MRISYVYIFMFPYLRFDKMKLQPPSPPPNFIHTYLNSKKHKEISLLYT